MCHRNGVQSYSVDQSSNVGHNMSELFIHLSKKFYVLDCGCKTEEKKGRHIDYKESMVIVSDHHGLFNASLHTICL